MANWEPEEEIVSATGVEEETAGDEHIAEPFDPTLIRVDTKLLTIDLLVTRMREGEINLAPDFQRKAGIWSNEAASRLIESMLIRIPLPAFYMDATDENKWVVVDGLQRLTTLRRFMLETGPQQLRLCGLEFLTQLSRLTFDQLPRGLQRRIQETQVTVYLVEKGTPPEVKFNVFKRINTGGLPLSTQEIRHALNQGPATRFLVELASSTQFQQATSGKIRDDRMADRECVLRFLSFMMNDFTTYKEQGFDAFLNKAMRALNKMAVSERSHLEQKFYAAMESAHRIFGEFAFRKRESLQETRLRPVNKALFEAWSVNLAQRSTDEITILVQRKEQVASRFVALMGDGIFVDAISQSTGGVKKVQVRFSRIRDLIEEVLSS